MGKKGYIGNEPTNVPLTTSDLVDGIITTAKLAANAVITAKLGYVMPRSYGRNFQGSANSASQYTFTADELVLQDASGYPMLLSSVSKVTDITVSGAGGLDTGAEAGNTWYYVWIIAKADGTVSSIFSTSATAPTMPTDYTFKALVSAVRNDGSSNLVGVTQRGKWLYYGAEQTALNGGTATSETSITITSYVPPSAAEFQVNCQITSSSISVAGGDTVYFRYITANNYFNLNVQSIVSAGQTNSAVSRFPNVSQTLLYGIAKSSTSTVQAFAYIQGYSLPIGGE